MPLVLTFVLNRFVFFEVSRTRRHGTVSTTWLRLRWWYAWYEVGLVLPNLAVGAAVLLVRRLMWMAMGLFYLGRLELAVMPSGRVGAFDPSFHVYLAMLRADHRYTNPVALVFFELLEEGGARSRRHRRRRRRRRRRERQARAARPRTGVRSRANPSRARGYVGQALARADAPDAERGRRARGRRGGQADEHGCLVCLGRVKEHAARAVALHYVTSLRRRARKYLAWYYI